MNTEGAIPELKINGDYIELCKLLKLRDWVSTGGEAKFVIADGQVSLNGAVETRKRKKIYNGDIIEFDRFAVKVTTD